MEAYRNILVPLDGSELSERILPEVERLASHFDASISLVRVAYVHSRPFNDEMRAQISVVRAAGEYLAGIEARLKEKGFKVDSHVRYGHAAVEILGHCERHDIDLIAMSTHGRSGVKKWFLGSVAAKVVHHATRPIFLVRSNE